jgi:Ca-activated chloride channel family protein
MIKFRFLLVTFAFLLLASISDAQIVRTRILFLFDGSGSMYGVWEKEQKINIAKRVLVRLVDSLGNLPDVEIALRAYGHSSPKSNQDCKDTRLEVPFGPNNKEAIKEKLKSIIPKGTTPIAYSLSMAAGDFPASKNVRNIIILITDGIEECKGDPCAVSIALQKRGVVLKPFIIGLDINDEFGKQLECVGNFFNAKNVAAFEQILNVVITNALNNTTTQVNLLDIYGKPTETDVNMTFYDAKSGLIRYNFYHTFDEYGMPDTLFIDPSYRYNITVHTIPKVDKLNVYLNPGKHNIIPISTPQGDLSLVMEGLTSYPKLFCLVRQSKQNDIMHVMEANKPEKIIVGMYDLEFLTLPRVKVPNVEIKQNETTKVMIDQPGKISIYTPVPVLGSIYQLINGKMEWVTNLDPALRNQIIIMQPGQYTISYRRKSARITYYTNEQVFIIKSGTSISLNLQ